MPSLNKIGFFCLGLLATGAGAVTILPNDPNILYNGRINFANPLAPVFDWSEIEITAVFSGTSIGVLLTDANNNYNAFIDGVLNQKIVTAGGVPQYDIKGLSNATHTLLLTKRTETSCCGGGTATFNGLVLASGGLLPPPAPNTRRIEFIGDSLTCGYGIEGPGVSCGSLRPYEDAYLTYAGRAARNFCADYHVEAQSGRGMVHNLGDPSVLSAQPVPYFYDRGVSNSASPTFNFSTWVPDAVVIRLGTNDYGGSGPFPTSAQYITGYRNFIATIRANYPLARLFLLCSNSESFKASVQSVVTQEISAGNTNIQFVALPDLWTADLHNLGCDYHPNTQGAQAEANSLITAIQSGMGWAGCPATSTPTITPSFSETLSPSETPSITLTETPAPPSATLTPSPTTTLTVAATVPAQNGPGKIDEAFAVPNPNPAFFALKMDGPADSLDLKIWSASMVLVAKASFQGLAGGWIQANMPADFAASASNGVYYASAVAYRGKEISGHSGAVKFIVLK